jgi:hypothetical protein
MRPFNEEAFALALKVKPKVVSIASGDPDDLAARIRMPASSSHSISAPPSKPLGRPKKGERDRRPGLQRVWIRRPDERHVPTPAESTQ